MSNASSTPIDGPLVFFGDSLSDDGNLYDQAAPLLNEETLSEFGGAGGRASNGAVWTETVDDLLDVTESYNYAIAGAEAIGTQTIGDFIDEAGLTDDLTVAPDDPALDWDMNLSAQIDRFAADAAPYDLSTTTAVILIGGNDYGAIDLSANPVVVLAQAAAALTGIVQSTAQAVTDLAAQGVGDIVVSSLPSFTFFPVFATLDPETQALADDLTVLHNQTLEAAIDNLAENGVPARMLEMRGITDAIVDDPGSFGLLAPYTLTLEEGAPEDLAPYDEDQVAFWDALHPTEATHGVIAAYSAYALEHDPTRLSAGDDATTLGDSDDLAFGYAGADTIETGAGDDSAFGGSGDESFSAAPGPICNPVARAMTCSSGIAAMTCSPAGTGTMSRAAATATTC